MLITRQEDGVASHPFEEGPEDKAAKELLIGLGLPLREWVASRIPFSDGSWSLEVSDDDFCVLAGLFILFFRIDRKSVLGNVLVMGTREMGCSRA